jgi:hypothetical protein
MAPNCAKGHRLTDSSVSGQDYDSYYENGYTCSICSDHYSDVEGHYDVTSGERWFCDDWRCDECLRCLPRATADARPEESAFAEVRPRCCSFAVPIDILPEMAPTTLTRLYCSELGLL